MCLVRSELDIQESAVVLQLKMEGHDIMLAVLCMAMLQYTPFAVPDVRICVVDSCVAPFIPVHTFRNCDIGDATTRIRADDDGR